MGEDAKSFYNAKTDTTSSQDKQERKERKQQAIVCLGMLYNERQKHVCKMKKNHSVEQQTLIQVYTQFGRLPRTSTFIKLYVVKNEDEADHNNKNYYIKATKTTVSNVHKTGVVDNKLGEPIVQIVVNLKNHPASNMDELAKTKPVIFQAADRRVLSRDII